MTIAGYAKSRIGSRFSCDSQELMILQYCKREGIEYSYFFKDYSGRERTTAEARFAETNLGIEKTFRQEQFFPQLEELMLMIMRGNITTIIVEHGYRLYGKWNQYNRLMELCEENDVNIIEVGNQNLNFERKPGFRSAAIYHFSNNLDRWEYKPINCEKETDLIYESLAEKGLIVCGSYYDKQIRKSNHKAYRTFRENTSSYDVLAAWDYRHIEDKTIPFMREARSLIDLGLDIITVRDGSIKTDDLKAISKRRFKAAVYISPHYEPDYCSLDLQKEAIELFIKLKTNWKIKGLYIDQTDEQKSGAQKELDKLIEEQDRFDIVVTRSMSKFNWRTGLFAAKRNRFSIPIYSIKEGFFNEKDI